MGFMSGSFMGQSLQFLELMPKFECDSTKEFLNPYPCKPEKFCGIEGIEHRVNYTDITSLNNWMLQMDLVCSSGAQIGLIGSMQFVGWAIASCFLPRISDLYGRKNVFLFSMALQLLSFIAMFFS